MTITWKELKDARSTRGWTQAQLAEAVGVHQKTIVNWEASGVPPKSEYKVRRALGPYVSFATYLTHVPEGQEPWSFDEWNEIRLRDDSSARDIREREVVRRGIEAVDADEERASELRLLRAELEQEDYDRRVSKQRALARFSSVELLDEVARRIRIGLPHDVSGDPEDDFTDEDFDVTHDDLSQKDVTLVAKKGQRKADQAPHAE